MTDIAKIIEAVGISEKGWSEAAQAALDEANKRIDRGWNSIASQRPN
jgi:flavin-binding protein dodecin